MQGTTIGYHQVGTINERDLELKPRDCLIWRHGPDVNCEDDKAMCSSWPLAAGFLHNGSAENLRRNTLVGCELALSDRADVRPFWIRMCGYGKNTNNQDLLLQCDCEGC